jgi:hypothetical protein
MADDFVSVRFVCPQCGQQLVGPSGKDEAQLSDTLSCPVHGDIGRFEEIAKKVGEEVARQTGDAFAKLFKDNGFTVEKE